MGLPNALSMPETGDQKNHTVYNLVTQKLCCPALVVSSAVGTAQELQEKKLKETQEFLLCLF